MQDAKSWVEVSARALSANLGALRDVATRATEDAAAIALLAVIKADAYGHGVELCAPVLTRAGAEWLGVTDAPEGVRVRASLAADGLAPEAQPRILIMCGLEPHDAPLIAQHHLTPVVWSAEHLHSLATAQTARPTPVHVEVDTGMARQGAPPGLELDHLLRTLAASPHLRLNGVLTHFASAEIAASPLTTLQQQRFQQALVQLHASGLRPRWLHAGNTSTIDEARLPSWLAAQARSLGARVLLRSGLALYGYTLPLEGASPALAPRLAPVATWKTRVIALRDVAPGDTVGYNATFTATRPMRLALLPVGYADGLRRELSSTSARGGGWVMLHGRRAPILGRVSMNLTTVDVSTIPEAALGDEAVLLGEGISAADHARLADTIPYEILCAMRGARRLIP